MGQRPSKVKERMRAVSHDEIALCAIVEGELRFGAENSSDPVRNLVLLKRFVAHFVVLPFDSEAAREYGRLRVHLQRTGNLIGGNDRMIASIALAHGLIVVTHNVGKFSKAPGLVVEDWEA